MANPPYLTPLHTCTFLHYSTYPQVLGGKLKKYLDLSAKIGGDVADHVSQNPVMSPCSWHYNIT